MSNSVAVASAAQRFAAKDEDALELLIGLQEKAIEGDPALATVPDLNPVYGTHMGLLDDVKSIGKRVALRWAKELHALVCGTGSGDQADREKILSALNLGESAVIAAVAAALMAALPAPISAAAAALIVKRFIWPAREELCATWGETLKG